MTIGILTFAAENTLGMAIVENAVRDRFPEAIVTRADLATAKHVDFLLVSLYWWRDIYEFVRFLFIAGIDPRKRKPIIIVGGSDAVNPQPIKDYPHPWPRAA